MTQILANKIVIITFSLVPVKYGINHTAAMGIFVWAVKQVWVLWRISHACMHMQEYYWWFKYWRFYPKIAKSYSSPIFCLIRYMKVRRLEVMVLMNYVYLFSLLAISSITDNHSFTCTHASPKFNWRGTWKKFLLIHKYVELMVI